ncbi:MAG: winged helix-turn-helix transcriptional regulator [Lacunisphaera sp.]
MNSRGTAAIVENLLKHKWSRTILRHLRDGNHDPVEISRIELDIAPSTMSERLRTMVRHNLIQRMNKYPREKVVLYRLTPKGRRILTVLDLIGQLDGFPDHDLRPLEEIFYLDLRVRNPAPLLLAETEPVLAAASGHARKNSTEKIAAS